MENTTFLERYYKISERHSTVKQEIIGGVTTFLAMSYIIFVNPSILGLTGMDKGALITVTCLTSALATIISGVWANAPFALAPGMGLNAFFTFTLVLGKGLPWQTALGIVFMSGCFFFVLSLGGIREKIADAIPMPLKIAVGGGIGLFITFIGLKSMGLIEANPATLVSLGKINITAMIGIVGLLVAVVLEIKQVKGGILIGIIISTILAFITGNIAVPEKLISLPPSIMPIAGKLDITGAFKLSLIGPIFSFMFVDLFDTLGTLISCSRQMGIVDKDGKIQGFGRMLYTDVFSTIIGSVLGTSTVTTYVESAAGVTVGARTGLASVVTGVLFLLALFFSPIVAVVPAYATAPALVLVGVYMFKNVKELDFKDLKTLFPCFIIIIMMPLTYSISIGLSLGFLSYIILHAVTGDFAKLNIPLIFIGLLCLINLIV
ncbi:Adenine permease AdeP [Fusobacterium sp. DD29]|uniref:NCS2 family permease n=1 Tax=unclassified Fusobacterium TaxID=2648384 RepID=UPI001B8D10A0|nr:MULTISPECIES: NCS2 family permease [unclassified Fusobacterium]MBR8700781.1 Adenine permease AdeP [Fusobacterium sp. DD45]MBR8710560.1 Adenine permease AdeP [Fusobacterium sp. DD28]MBR8748992.1 Adenine permease AdeP [Fusobacterium sp. DD29]MBR8751170.1 Adenine permease AdeP [Fusobacterium sp. DD26]MBR8761199.1 Adenine permease AdeP [Fusobacterium sp. DD25]